MNGNIIKSIEEAEQQVNSKKPSLKKGSPRDFFLFLYANLTRSSSALATEGTQESHTNDDRFFAFSLFFFLLFE